MHVFSSSKHNRASVVECPFRAYCRTSILLSNSGSNFVMVKPSIILAKGKVQVSEIGLKSLSIFFGGITLEIGLTMEDLEVMGYFRRLDRD